MPSDNATNSKNLVSVICRSIGRKELDQALQSIVGQTHSVIEVILVDAAETDLAPAAAEFPSLNCRVVSTGAALDRSSAANAGLEAATGEWMLFLDDDDWLAPNHIASLLEALEHHPDCKAAYSSVQKTDSEGNAIDYRFEQDFDPLLLMRDNYIPIHAMLFHRSLLAAGCQFDARFNIYEDWDFWLQLSEHTEFLHVDKLTAFYRQGGESDTDLSDTDLRYRSDSETGIARAKIFEKWMQRWSGSQVNTLLGSLDQSELISSIVAELDSEHATNLAHQEQIRNMLERIKKLLEELEAVRSHLAHANKKIDVSQDKIDVAQDKIAALESRIDALLNSTSWKLTAPLRGLANLAKGDKKSPDDSEDNS